MKISSAALFLGLALCASDGSAGRFIQRKRADSSISGQNGRRGVVPDALDDNALWERILQDAGMSMPPTSKSAFAKGRNKD